MYTQTPPQRLEYKHGWVLSLKRIHLFDRMLLLRSTPVIKLSRLNASILGKSVGLTAMTLGLCLTLDLLLDLERTNRCCSLALDDVEDLLRCFCISVGSTSSTLARCANRERTATRLINGNLERRGMPRAYCRRWTLFHINFLGRKAPVRGMKGSILG